MFFKLPVALLLTVVSVALANAIPADPTITPAAILPRQVDADWIGWVKDPDSGTCMLDAFSNTWTMLTGTGVSQSCDAGGTWYRSGTALLLHQHE